MYFSSAVMIHGLLLFGAYSDGEKEDNTTGKLGRQLSVQCVCGVAGSMRPADREHYYILRRAVCNR